MRLKNIVKLLSVGAITFVMAGCGGGGGSTNVPPPTPEPPVDSNLMDEGDIRTIYVPSKSNILISISTGYCRLNLYDANFNRITVDVPNHSFNSLGNGDVYTLEAGEYNLLLDCVNSQTDVAVDIIINEL